MTLRQAAGSQIVGAVMVGVGVGNGWHGVLAAVGACLVSASYTAWGRLR